MLPHLRSSRKDSQLITDDNLLPLLQGLDPKKRIVISTIGNNSMVKFNSGDRKEIQWYLIIIGTISLLTGYGVLKCVSPYDWIMADLLEMRSFSPIYPIWTNPPHLVTCSVTIFEVVNPEEFLASDDPRVVLQMREVGPVLYREHIKHVNITHHDNGTMSFSTVRWVTLSDHNEPGVLNRSILVPNYGLIGALSYLHKLPFLTKLPFNVMLNAGSESVFLNITVHDFLWNYYSEVVTMGNKVLPNIFPVKNLGFMYRSYRDSVNRVNVKIGKKNGFKEFFNMQQYNYGSSVPGYEVTRGDCNASIGGATEAYLMSRKMTNETVLKYFRKSICKVVHLNYQGETELQGLKALKFVDSPESYKTWKADGSRDCFSGLDDHILPDGLTDLSRCYYNFPMVMSPPHFLGYENESYARRVSGLKSDPELHESRMFVEPLLGIGMKELARSQMNTYVHDLSGFPAIFNRLSGMVIPVAWVDLRLDEVPTIPLLLIKFVVRILPLIDYVLPLLFLGFGFTLYSKATKKWLQRRSKSITVLKIICPLMISSDHSPNATD